jgi:HEAT repeat protein
VIKELELLRERARIAIAREDHDAAVESLRSAASRTETPERDYVALLLPLADALAKTNDPRGALTVIAYVASTDPGRWGDATALLPDVMPIDRARVLAATGHADAAAREAEASGSVASAAFFQEMGRQWHAARTLWARLASRLAAGSGSAAASRPAASGEDLYVAALVNFNLARCARQCADGAQAREATVTCVRLLEEAADRFESVGQRERAFDCFQVMTQIGRESGAFEDVLEGFVNCIRILREDHLKHFALQHYDEAIDAAAGRGEASAGATLAREAAAYARSLGLVPRSNGYVSRQAELWRVSAREHTERGAPAAIAENSLLASVLAYGEIGQASQVRQVYGDLARLDLDPARREHYRRAQQRYVGMRDEPCETPAAPTHPATRSSADINEVWRVDVLEWERAGAASEVCADVMLDPRRPEFIRRRAMLARLTALEAERRRDDPSRAAEALRERLAGELAQVQLYAVLSPLEHLFARPERRVKVAVLQAIATLSFFKRSFVTVRAGLADADPSVVAQAIAAVASLDFEQAFDPLSRLVRESADPNARAAALRSLARIATTEAADFLRGVLEHGFPADRMVVADALKRRP